MNKEIYLPREDSFFFLEYLEKINLKNKKILDMGTGSGILAKKCFEKNPKKIYAVDINKKAVEKTKNRLEEKQNQDVVVLRSNLFDKIKNIKFDLILFNPPYLPSNENEAKREIEKAWLGGEDGLKIIKKFLNQAKNHLSDKGKILLLISNKTNNKEFKRFLTSIGYNYRVVKEKKLFFEKLFLYGLTY